MRSRFSPVEVVRHARLTRFEIWSPKRAERLTLFSHEALALWAMIEATPSITSFCPYPGMLVLDDDHPRPQLVDFWVHREGQDECLLLRDAPQLVPAPHHRARRLPEQWKHAVRWIESAELQAHEQWVRNWLQILPYLTSNRALIEPPLLERILVHLGSSPRRLTEIEAAEAPTDPMLTRTAVFELIRRGRIDAPQLRAQPLGGALALQRAQ